MSKAQDRILEIDITDDESADTVVVTGMTFYRTRANLEDSDGYSPAFTAGAAGASTEVELGEVIYFPSIIRLNVTNVP